MKKYKKYIFGALAIALIFIQFFQIDKTNPPTPTENDFITMTQPPAEIAEMLKNSCYDCHSNHTKYPWYTNVSPLSHWIKGHIDNGRKKLNFSTWNQYDAGKRSHKLEEIAEEVKATHMPIFTYTLMHSDAKMTTEERAAFVKYYESL